jgi:hypothetical protein
VNRFKKPEDYPVAVKVIVKSKTDNRDNTAIFELQTIYVDFAVFIPSLFIPVKIYLYVHLAFKISSRRRLSPILYVTSYPTLVI